MVISSQLNNSLDRLFVKAKHGTLSFIFSILLSLGLIFFDHHHHYLHMARSGFSLLISPLQYSVAYPFLSCKKLYALFTSKTALIDENERLRYQQVLLEARLQKFMALQEENIELKGLLLTSSKSKIKAMAAHILSINTTLARQLMILDKGQRDGIYLGQPVLDSKGVMGQIVDVGYMTSTVLLISDAKSAVPVRNTRTGEQAILVGSNNLSQLSLVNLPKTAEIRKGDVLLTSGLGQLYPEGYPVGQVVKVKSIPGEGFLHVEVTPIASLNRNRLVLLLWHSKEQSKLIAQINERMNVIAGSL